MDIVLAICTVLGGITAIWYFWEKYRSKKKDILNLKEYVLEEKKVAKINIKLTPQLDLGNIRFGMLYIRDGKDQISDHGPLLNQEILTDIHKGSLLFRVEYVKRLGFQFKCFIDYQRMTYSKAKQLLEQAGFVSLKKGEGKYNRIWFILSKYEVCTTDDGITNNFLLPILKNTNWDGVLLFYFFQLS